MSTILFIAYSALLLISQTADSQSEVNRLIEALKPRTTSVARPALEYRIREERSRANRWAAVGQLELLGPKAAPAVPILTQLVVDRFEPKMLRIQMLRALTNIGSNASSALPTIEKLVASDDAELKQAAEAAIWTMKTKAEFIRFLEDQNEREIESRLASVASVGELSLPLLCRVYETPNLSHSLRDRAYEHIEQIRYRSNYLLFSFSENDSFLGDGQLTAPQIYEVSQAILVADRILIERFPEELSATTIQHLVNAVTRLTDPSQNIAMIRRQLILCATALSRQSKSFSEFPDQFFAQFRSPFRSTRQDPELQELIRQCMIRFVESRQKPKQMILDLLASPSSDTYALGLNLLRSHPTRFSIAMEDLQSFPVFFEDEVAFEEGANMIWSPDYRYVAIWTCRSNGSFFGGGGNSGTPVRVLDVQSGLRVGEFGVSSIDPVFSPDGRFLVDGDSDETKLWNLESKELHVVLNTPKVARATFSSHGRKLLITHMLDGEPFISPGKTISVWDIETGMRCEEPSMAGVNIVAVSIDRSRIAGFHSSFPGKILVWDTNTGREISQIDAAFLGNEQILYMAMLGGLSQLSADGKRLFLFELKVESNGMIPHATSFHEFDLETNRVVRSGALENTVGRVVDASESTNLFPLRFIQSVGDNRWEMIDLDDRNFAVRIDWSSPNHPLHDFLSATRDLDQLITVLLTDELLLFNDGSRQCVFDISTGKVDEALAWNRYGKVKIRDQSTGADSNESRMHGIKVLSFIEHESGPFMVLRHEVPTKRIQVLRLLSHKQLLEVP